MAKYVVLNDFKDVDTGVTNTIGELIELTEDRAKEILENPKSSRTNFIRKVANVEKEEPEELVDEEPEKVEDDKVKSKAKKTKSK